MRYNRSTHQAPQLHLFCRAVPQRLAAFSHTPLLHPRTQPKHSLISSAVHQRTSTG